MSKLNKKCCSIFVASLMLLGGFGVVINNNIKSNAAEPETVETNDDASYFQSKEELPIINGGTEADEASNKYTGVISRYAQTRDITINAKAGARLTSDTWCGTRVRSGSTYQWDYQVAAKVNLGFNTGYQVERIRTTWIVGASLRNSASLDIGVSKDGTFKAGGSSSWQNVESKPKYWENTKGQKEASYRTNFIVKPARDYRDSTRYVTNTAFVKLKNNAKTYEISSGV